VLLYGQRGTRRADRIGPVVSRAVGAVGRAHQILPSLLWNWIRRPEERRLVDDAIYTLSRSGPALGRQLVDTITNSKIANLKELRPGSRGRSEIRILFVFDPWRSAILILAGDKAGN
jgi:hypothetical protein